MKKTTKSIAAVLALMVGGGLVGCATSGSDSKDALDSINETGVLTVGIEAAYPPFNYYDDTNTLVGFDVDITQEIADRMGVEVEYVPTPWDSIIGGLLADKYDLIISSVAITDERKQKVDFTDPYYHTGSQLFTAQDSDITDPTKISGKKIGVAIGTTFADKARELGAEVVEYKSDLLAFEDVANGRIDGLLTDGPVGNAAIKDGGYDIKMIGEPLIEAEAGIALNKGEEAFLTELNKQLKAMLSDGTYTEISEKWFGADIR